MYQSVWIVQLGILRRRFLSIRTKMQTHMFDDSLPKVLPPFLCNLVTWLKSECGGKVRTPYPQTRAILCLEI